jgi:hypothetical protein
MLYIELRGSIIVNGTLEANLNLDSCNFINNGAAITAMPTYGGVEVGVKISGAFSPGQSVQNFNNNRLCYNTKYNVENGSDLNLGLEKNCFCLQDSAAIEALIYDGYDVYKLVGLEFQAKDVNDYQID